MKPHGISEYWKTICRKHDLVKYNTNADKGKGCKQKEVTA